MPSGIYKRKENMKTTLIDLIGRRFGRLIVVKRNYSDPRNRKNIMWLCKCDCGTEKIIAGANLRNGNTKSCGCLCREVAGKSRTAKGSANMRLLIHRYKSSAKRRGHSYNLTEKQFKEITQKDCYYCGSGRRGIVDKRGLNGSYTYNGIDRVENKKGYTIDNVVPCCKHCNVAKNTFTPQEFKNWIKKVYDNFYTGGMR